MKLASKILIPLILIGCLATGVGLYIHSKNKANSIDESKLYIGIPKSQDNLPVKLEITVNSSSGSQVKEYSSEELSTLKGQDDNLVFLDYATNPLIPLEGREIGYWLSEKDNSIKIRSIALNFIISDFVKIDKSGIWMINVAKSNGQTSDFSHSYIYKSGGLFL